MPRVGPSITPGGVKAIASVCLEPADNPLSFKPKGSSGAGFGEGVCTCAKCMRKNGPLREDTSQRALRITHALAGVYEDTENPEELITEQHQQSADDFILAVEQGNITKLQCLFNHVEEEEIRQEIASELIISAAQVGQADVIRLLYDVGANLEETDLKRQGKPLMYAAYNGYTAAVKMLVELGADLEATDENGYTALMVCVFADRSSSAALLLQAGAQVDAEDPKGRTALSLAAMYGSTDCIYLLAQHGADVFHPDYEGRLPLDMAEEAGRDRAADALRKLQTKVKMQRRRERKSQKQQDQELSAHDLLEKERRAKLLADQLIQEEEARKKEKDAKAGKKKKKGGSSSKAKVEEQEQQQEEEQQQQQQQQQQRQSPPPGAAAPAGPAPPSSLPPVQYQDTSQLQQVLAGISMAQRPVTAPPPTHLPPAFLPPALQLQQRLQMLPPALQMQQQLQQQQQQQLPFSPPLQQQQQAPLSPPQPQQQQPEPEPPKPVDVDTLRKEWEALLEEAARCLDEQQQPLLQSQVEALLPQCQDAGISVKYGRKVLQRLQAAAPARAALRAAVNAQPPSSVQLDAALQAAKAARSLLDPQLLQAAEQLLQSTRADEEQARWSSLAHSLSWERSSGGEGGSSAAAAGAAGGGGSASGLQSHGSLQQLAQYEAALGDEQHLNEETECVVCLSEMKNTACVPCGHVCMCSGCADDVAAKSGQCPVCRAHIDVVIPIAY